jgi:hypothetical protein
VHRMVPTLFEPGPAAHFDLLRQRIVYIERQMKVAEVTTGMPVQGTAACENRQGRNIVIAGPRGAASRRWSPCTCLLAGCGGPSRHGLEGTTADEFRFFDGVAQAPRTWAAHRGRSTRP